MHTLEVSRSMALNVPVKSSLRPSRELALPGGISLRALLAAEVPGFVGGALSVLAAAEAEVFALLPPALGLEDLHRVRAIHNQADSLWQRDRAVQLTRWVCLPSAQSSRRRSSTPRRISPSEPPLHS